MGMSKRQKEELEEHLVTIGFKPKKKTPAQIREDEEGDEYDEHCEQESWHGNFI